MKKDNSKITMKWNLMRIQPRLDIYFEEKDLEKIQNIFSKFKYRSDNIGTYRHYKLPFRFHFYIVREYYRRKLYNYDEQ